VLQQWFVVCVVGVQDTEDDVHDETEYGAEEPLREQAILILFGFYHMMLR